MRAAYISEISPVVKHDKTLFPKKFTVTPDFLIRPGIRQRKKQSAVSIKWRY